MWYTGERNLDGRKVIIKKTSVKTQIIVDAVEDGMIMAMVHALVNKHCYEAEQEPYSLSSVWRLILSLDPVVSPLVKLKQGDTDPDSAWSWARYNWVLQLLIRFGLFVYLEKNDTVVVPPKTAYHSSININDDLITVTTTTTASNKNNIPDCFNEKNCRLYPCIKLCGGMSLTKCASWPQTAMRTRCRYAFIGIPRPPGKAEGPA
jgi:hypothetical protein